MYRPIVTDVCVILQLCVTRSTSSDRALWPPQRFVPRRATITKRMLNFVALARAGRFRDAHAISRARDRRPTLPLQGLDAGLPTLCADRNTPIRHHGGECCVDSSIFKASLADRKCGSSNCVCFMLDYRRRSCTTACSLRWGCLHIVCHPSCCMRRSQTSTSL